MHNRGAALDVLENARAQLKRPLNALQTFQRSSPQLTEASQCLAAASSALYEAETELAVAGSEERTTTLIRRSVEELGRTLGLVELLARTDANLDVVSESIARALALLYPLAQRRLRQRRAVMLKNPDQPDAPLAFVPRAPEPSGARPAASTAPAGRNSNRRDTPRAVLEVDIGLLSHSHFYTGLAMDLSKGGLFVATYEPLTVGTLVTLFFVLPSGEAVEAPGTVRWARIAKSGAPPGMGVAFDELGPQARRAIAAFCERRSPLFHDSGDD